MKKLRAIKLTEPLSEATRPKNLSEIIGQESGLLALRAALCSSNPQHVIIYGPPGVGKTAAARLMLDEAIKSGLSPFKANAPFIELDATILQFDERSIADPLIGSVHDPIYHGAGSYGQAGIPHPKAGAATKAHGGTLFIDEIGELNNTQLNRLLKVLEDRKVIVSSSYYSKSNKNIPKHIHDIFENGLPADFRLIGATTKDPLDIPEALRSRCREIHFRPLGKSDIIKIAKNALYKSGLRYDKRVPEAISEYSENGRDAVNIAGNAASLAIISKSPQIEFSHIESILEHIPYVQPLNVSQSDRRPKVGCILVPVVIRQKGLIAEIEAAAFKSKGLGNLIINGIAQTEEIHARSGKIIKKSTALASIENAIAALKNVHGIDVDDYNIYLSFSAQASSQTIIDGPSAGCAVFCAIYSAILKLPIPSDIIISGEISITGKVRPVGQIKQKLEAAQEHGFTKAIIPRDNHAMDSRASSDIQIISAKDSRQLIQAVFGEVAAPVANANVRLINLSNGDG